ncbi:hypothetical protein RFI_09840 [Reticulomyxa filosa]|uniref:Diphosphomevalonate decarboxylase n=1 Tax=Reticulomyxa filosa TaxID=46433 RepID=X6NNL0_RETFI|nr:hypothetical protein RFI_09840 [Reticulomyxa filosa]|eukprot:ETO27294.1 hypothetical protein RFI_09840 [Reticulomyxa filosa]
MSAFSSQVITVTCEAPINIALTKYWGKDEQYPLDLNVPLNDSISMTLDPGVLRTTTTITASPSFKRHEMWLNGKEIELSQRMVNVIRYVQHHYVTSQGNKKNKDETPARNFRYFQIRSANNFPTAAGLASSASGFAALTYALCKIHGMDKDSMGDDISALSRVGSGSSTRSLYGGFVRWYANINNNDKSIDESKNENNENRVNVEDTRRNEGNSQEYEASQNPHRSEATTGNDHKQTTKSSHASKNVNIHQLSVARQVKDEKWWPDLRVIILVVSDQTKSVSSSKGMQITAVNVYAPQRKEKYMRDFFKNL